jgi:hypothetical protein
MKNSDLFDIINELFGLVLSVQLIQKEMVANWRCEDAGTNSTFFCHPRARASLALERYTSAPSQPFALMFLGKILYAACRL